MVYVNAPLCDFYVNIFPTPSRKSAKNVFGNRTDVITAKFWEALLVNRLYKTLFWFCPTGYESKCYSSNGNFLKYK